MLAYARAAQRAGVRRFAIVSALGANARSGNFYSRVKGEAEDAIRDLGYPGGRFRPPRPDESAGVVRPREDAS